MSSRERRWRLHWTAVLRELNTWDTCESGTYRKPIYEYNSSVAFASVGAEIISPHGNGPYYFRIDGQIYYLVSPLHPDEAHKSGYWQIYIFDCANETTERLEDEWNQWCMAKVIQRLDELLRNVTHLLNHINGCKKWDEICEYTNRMRWYLINNL
jgi:hypothetical protein